MRSDERVEELMDAALRSYAEPGEVQEARVVLARALERDRASGSRRQRGWVWGAAAGLALMVILGAVWMMRGPRRAEIAWAPAAPVVASIGPADRDSGAKAPLLLRGSAARLKSCPDTRACPGVMERVRQTPSLTGSRVAQARESLPKLDVFPAPTPLSSEEQALVAFAKHGPHEVQRAVIEDQKHWDDPIIVADADLQEQPLQARQQLDQ